MSQQIAASVYMITLNEENNVAESLASVADFAEVIIVDSGSTDRTLDRGGVPQRSRFPQ